MRITNITEAKANLSRLVDRAAEGERIVLGKAGRPMAMLVPFTLDPSPRELGGAWIGKVEIATDFDELPADVAADFGMEPPPGATGAR
jgi:prevent-host-death family protein